MVMPSSSEMLGKDAHENTIHGINAPLGRSLSFNQEGGRLFCLPHSSSLRKTHQFVGRVLECVIGLELVG